MSFYGVYDFNYTVSQNNVTTLSCYKNDIHESNFDGFWQKCYSESKQSKHALFSQLT